MRGDRPISGVIPAGAAGIRRALHPTVHGRRAKGAGDVAERSLLIDDAAAALGVSRRTIYYRIREGRLVTIRTRCGSQRVLLSSIERLREEGRQPAVRRAAGRAPGSEPEALALQVQPLP
jgi:excisionase family DNA binding protein